MNLRENVLVDGVPYIWSTNLTDDGVREFYELYAEQIRKPDPSTDISTPNKMVFQIACRLAFFDFRDGVCFWNASENKHHVLYRSNQEWEFWNARQREIQELRDEQAAEQATERVIVVMEDNHLKEKANAAIAAGAFDTAAAYITARMELRLTARTIRCFSYPHSEPSHLWWEFTQFPRSHYGIEFLSKYDSEPQSFINFAHWFSSRCGLTGDKCGEQTNMIYERGMTLFPDNASLAAAACLFWRRVKRYDLAMKVCSDAIKKGLKDNTKSGFVGRMKRLDKESKRNRIERPSMNWFETVKAEIETFFGGNDFTDEELRQRGLAAVDAFHSLFTQLVNELKIRDDFAEQNRRYLLSPTQNIERSAKMQIDFTMGVDPVDGWFIEAPIACEDHIRYMKDDYWFYITKLASIGKAKLQSDYPPEWYSSSGTKRLIQHDGSLVFSIARNFTLAALSQYEKFSVGLLTATIPLESDENATTQFFRNGLNVLYRSNYLLHRSATTRSKPQPKQP